MKYIVLKVYGKTATVEYPIIFPNSLTHATVASALILSGDDILKLATVVAAGEIASVALEPECHGRSVSLGGIASRGIDDNVLIRMNDYFHGVVPDD